MNVTDIIYHGGCPDGFTSVWLLQSVFPEAALHYGKHGDEPPEVDPDATVVIADFSYPWGLLNDLAARCDQVVVLDHHKTAQENLVDLPMNVEVIFDMERSGARIVYDWLWDNQVHFDTIDGRSLSHVEMFNFDGPEILVDYVQDYDLWNKVLPDTEEIGAVIRSTPFEMNAWSALARRLQTSKISVVESGRAIFMNTQKVLETHVETAREIIIDGHTVLAVSIPYMFGSSIAELLCTGENEHYPFGAYYIHHPWGTQWGLRSRNEFDVSEVAERFGGGGHKNAAGFKIPNDWGFEQVKVGSVF